MGAGGDEEEPLGFIGAGAGVGAAFGGERPGAGGAPAHEDQVAGVGIFAERDEVLGDLGAERFGMCGEERGNFAGHDGFAIGVEPRDAAGTRA